MTPTRKLLLYRTQERRTEQKPASATDARLVAQIVGLERRTARGGRDSIDHAPGAHDDVANA
jgi:hypothetical protein